AYAHQDIPFEMLVEKLQPTRSLSHSPLFQVMFVLQNTEMNELDLPGLDIAAMEMEHAVAKFDLTLNVAEQDGQLHCSWAYATDLFADDSIQRMAGHFETLLNAIVDNPQQAIGQLPMLTAQETLQLQAWNDTATGYPKNRTIIDLFEQQAAATPDNLAVVFDGQSLSYRQLNDEANQLAHYLSGLKTETGAPLLADNPLIAIAVERSLDMIVGLLAILKAGGAYVPVDPHYPAVRIRHMLKDSQAPLLLTQSRLQAQLPLAELKHDCMALCLDELDVSGQPAENLTGRSGPEDLAYVIYTSGSTGMPKGAGVFHKGVTNLVHWFTTKFQLNSRDRVLIVSPFSFDLTQKNIFAPLIIGGQLHLPTSTHYDPNHLCKIVEEQKITWLNCAPSAFYPLLEPNDEHRFLKLASLRYLFLGGEAIVFSRLKAWLDFTDGRTKLVNGYGPTECTAICAAYLLEHDREAPSSRTIPIGKPIYNCKVFILDKNLALLPIGVPGELCIAGIGIGSGYLNRPELTAEKFVEIELFGKSVPIYRTGDLAKWLPDGNLEYLGRIDHQIKLRGFRIELGEIDAVLGQHPDIQQVVTNLYEADGDKRIVAYLTTAQDNFSSDELRNWLKAKLPDYMVPSHFMVLDSLPLTPNGKIDRKALPAPERKLEMLSGNDEYPAAQTATEQALAEVWQNILNVGRIGRHDNFFELGGHSLLLAQLIHRIEADLKVQPVMRELFSAPTLSTQAAYLDACLLTQKNEGTSSQTIDFAAESRLDPAILPPTADFALSAEDLRTVLITGASGFLGAYLVDELARQTTAALYCLVRADDADHGRQRLQKNLERHGLWRESLAPRLHVVAGDLEQPRLGLSTAEFNSLAERIDAIYHSGAHDNFLYPYAMLKAANVDGTHELLRLAGLIRTKPLHFVSTLSVVSPQVEQVLEKDPLTPPEQTSTGYAGSKWVAEQLVQLAGRRGMPVTIHRPAQIIGISGTGFSHVDDAWFRRLLNDIQLGVSPDHGNDVENLVPVGFVSRALVYLSLQQASLGKVFHLANPSPTPKSVYQEVLCKTGYPIAPLPFAQWLERFTEASKTVPDLALAPLLPLFSGHNAENHESAGPSVQRRIDSGNTTAGLASSGIGCPRVSHEVLHAYFAYLIGKGHFPPPQ
ncbi:MAG: amino acid adenylation domain-containing protein, partial [Methylovulum sp.]